MKGRSRRIRNSRRSFATQLIQVQSVPYETLTHKKRKGRRVRGGEAKRSWKRSRKRKRRNTRERMRSRRKRIRRKRRKSRRKRRGRKK